jgi:hypothetical protein
MIQNMWPLIIAIAAIAVIITALKAMLAGNKGQPKGYPYEKGPALFTPAERSFLGVLEQAVDGRLRIMGKVRLADVVKVGRVPNRKAWQTAFNRIQAKHVDFVACDTTTLDVKFVVELDEPQPAQQAKPRLLRGQSP